MVMPSEPVRVGGDSASTSAFDLGPAYAKIATEAKRQADDVGGVDREELLRVGVDELTARAEAEGRVLDPATARGMLERGDPSFWRRLDNVGDGLTDAIKAATPVAGGAGDAAALTAAGRRLLPELAALTPEGAQSGAITVENGPATEDLQRALSRLGFYTKRVDGDFGEGTLSAVKQFAAKVGLASEAMEEGKIPAALAGELFAAIGKVGLPNTGKEWPPPPADLKPAKQQEREAMFGRFNYRPVGDGDIKILGDWVQKNIGWADLPQLKNAKGMSKRGGVTGMEFNKKAVPQLEALFQAWQDAGLIHLILSFAGSFVPRFVRGSTTSLSNHSSGSAFDINDPQNGLHVQPALAGQPGSVRELVPLANVFGFFWGGHYRASDGSGRLIKDGMHFEVAKLLSPQQLAAAVDKAKTMIAG
jgi:peptidoglycan hydrolase-like protein with peptidoglycan-binding domain